MICIIIRREKAKSVVVYQSFNYNEALEMLESVALDYIVERQGTGYLQQRHFHKKIPSQRGLFAMSFYNNVKVYEKKKDGIIYTGQAVELVSFELFTVRFDIEKLPRFGVPTPKAESDVLDFAMYELLQLNLGGPTPNAGGETESVVDYIEEH